MIFFSSGLNAFPIFNFLGTLKGGRADWLIEKCTVSSFDISTVLKLCLFSRLKFNLVLSC